VVDRPHELRELLVDDRDEHLGGIDGLEDLGADGRRLDPVDEVLDDLEADVGGEEGAADLLEALFDVGLGEAALAGKLPEDAAQGFAQGLEHGSGILTFKPVGCNEG